MSQDQDSQEDVPDFQDAQEAKVDPPQPQAQEEHLTEEEWRDPQILKLVQTVRAWVDGHQEPSAEIIIPFIYTIIKKVYTIARAKNTETRQHLVTATFLHALDTKKDWSSESQKQAIMDVVASAIGDAFLLKDLCVGCIASLKKEKES